MISKLLSSNLVVVCFCVSLQGPPGSPGIQGGAGKPGNPGDTGSPVSVLTVTAVVCDQIKWSLKTELL